MALMRGGDLGGTDDETAAAADATNVIRQIARTVPSPVATFLLTSETSAEKIVAHHRRTFTSTLQLVELWDAGNEARRLLTKWITDAE